MFDVAAISLSFKSVHQRHRGLLWLLVRLRLKITQQLLKVALRLLIGGEGLLVEDAEVGEACHCHEPRVFAQPGDCLFALRLLEEELYPVERAVQQIGGAVAAPDEIGYCFGNANPFCSSSRATFVTRSLTSGESLIRLMNWFWRRSQPTP